MPVAGGLAVHLSTPEGVSALAASLIAPPADAAVECRVPAIPPIRADSGAPGEAAKRRQRREREVVTEILLPRVVDLSGDRRPDLLYRDSARDGDGVRVRLNLGEGRFGPAFDPLPGWSLVAAPALTVAAEKEAEAPSREVVWLGDLDGDGPAEVVTSQEIPNPKDSMRAELAEAKRPRARIRVHALGADGRWNPAPKAEFTVEGYVFEGGGRETTRTAKEGAAASPSRRGCATSTATAGSTWSR